MSNSIEAKVAEFVANKVGFTSVNVANAIKVDGEWIPNREVAAWLRAWDVDPEYTVTRISVTLEDGTSARATVYMPEDQPISAYTGRDERAMTPDEFEQRHGFNPVVQVQAPPSPPAAQIPSLDPTAAAAPAATVGDALRQRFNFPKAS